MLNWSAPYRILMGPGPSDVDPDVLKSLSTPLVGHLDPSFLDLMNKLKVLLQDAFNTKNEMTLAMSGTGSAGMETLVVNLIEAGDNVVVFENGLFSQRFADAASRVGANVIIIKHVWGQAITTEQVREVFNSNNKIDFVFMVHSETSTGVMQPLKEIGEVVRANNALFLVDMVTSLGGIPCNVDENLVDAAFSGTQKCLSVPPGLAPVTMNDRAVNKLMSRKTQVLSWYFDLTMIQKYWGEERFYHHTAPISMVYALYTALEKLKAEGFENVYKRHAKYGSELQNGIQKLGLNLVVKDNEHRLPQLTSIEIPQGIDDVTFRKRLLSEYGIEIGGGLGDLKGKVWRVGLMGVNARKSNVALLLSAFEELLIKK
ncbi:MAG: alanine--glyoxylate aminotransferase [Bacillales bacterium]|jgi:alanine-glyoxylate transaminase/serine-glyoxylate transaminase/serine-pyruvate transaminase|nr:alanine--glyoxylate aminotransferase [Bacillales bacterium]